MLAQRERSLINYKIRNSEGNLLCFVDLHGMHSADARIKLGEIFLEIKKKLDEGMKPNHDDKNHIFHIITGVGKHSKD